MENLITELIGEKFINEERFAKAYAGGKFRIKPWGRYKIQQGLKQHQISEHCIKKAWLKLIRRNTTPPSKSKKQKEGQP